MTKKLLKMVESLFLVNSKKLIGSNAYREFFKNTIDLNLKTLEIGPFVNPIITGSNVEYFDVLSTENLKLRAEKIGLESKRTPYINYVHASGDLSIIKKKYDQVVSSHLIEHQPCLVAHLNSVEKLLEKKGKYFLITPDKRYCFDHFIPETTIADVLQAYHEKRDKHTLSSVIEHRALITHNNPMRHWNADHGERPSISDLSIKITNAKDEYYQAAENYIDVHAWQFTPDNFANIIEILNHLKISNLKIDELNKTPHGRFEFTAILKNEQ
jgi:hypothetical protein